MKKLLPVILLSFVFLFLFSGPAYASLCIDPATGVNNNVQEFLKYGDGLVPCGISVDNNGVPICRCELGHLFVMGAAIYGFILWYVAAPLASILIVAGGIMYILAGAKPEYVSTAKRLIWGAVIGVLLILGSWLIVDVVLRAIGYTGPWNSISF